MGEAFLNQLVKRIRYRNITVIPWSKAEASHPGSSTSFTEFDPNTKKANVERLLEQVNYQSESDVLVEFACGRTPSVPSGFLYELDFNATDFPSNYKYMGKDAIAFPDDVKDGKIPGGKRKIVVMYNALNYFIDRMRSQKTLGITEEEVEVLKSEPHNSLNSIEEQESVLGRALASIISVLEQRDLIVFVQEDEGRRQQFALIERLLGKNSIKHSSKYYQNEAKEGPVVLTLTDFR